MNKKYVNYSNYNDENITKYFKDIKKSTPISQEEEIDLAEKIKDGDSKAVEKLVNANLRFVVSIAKDYQGQGLSFADLISEGNYGLVKAAHRFDHTRGFRFISYAVWWIRQSIIQGLNENARMVRLPSNVINKISVLKKEIDKFEMANEMKPVYSSALLEKYGLLNSSKCISLNETINEDGDELIELMGYDVEDELVIDERIKKELNETLSVLDERERNIIESYYGINTECEPMTLEAIGDKYSLTKERIRQIKEKSMLKIRHNTANLYQLLNE